MDKNIFDCVNKLVELDFGPNYETIKLVKNEYNDYNIETSYVCDKKHKRIILPSIYRIYNFIDELYFKVIVNISAKNFKINDISNDFLLITGGSPNCRENSVLEGYSNIAMIFHDFIFENCKLNIIINEGLDISLNNDEVYQFIHATKAFPNQPNLKEFRLFVNKLKSKTDKTEVKCYFDLKDGKLHLSGFTDKEFAKISLMELLK